MRLALLLALSLSAAAAQTVVRGTVTDAETGGGLPAATVQVPGTTRGTISNAEGAFELSVPAGADSLVIRFLGYETARVAVAARVQVALAPAVAALGEAVVTGEDPAEGIMRRVIARKARWRAGLPSWSAEVYSRQTLRARGAVVAVIESQTTAYWSRDDGLREVVEGTRRTGNLGAVPLDAFGAAEQALNLYDDDVPFGGYDLMGPTHPDALRFYRFEVVGRRVLGADLVVDLAFAPRNPLQPGFEGTLAVLTDADALVAVSVRPSGAVQFPLVEGFALTLDQQFATFGQAADGEAVWLPVDFRMDARARPGNALLQFPDLGIAIASRFTDYALGAAPPDSLFAEGSVAVDSAAVAQGLPAAGVVPLSAEEARALAEIDSTQTLAEAFRPTGLLARFVTVDADDGSAASADGPSGRLRVSLASRLAYNRAAGAVAGGTLTARAAATRLRLGLAYETGSGNPALDVRARTRVGRTWLGARMDWGVAPIGTSFWVDSRLNTGAALFAGEDYFDYSRRLGGEVWAEWVGRGAVRPRARLGAALFEHDPAPTETTFSLTGSLPDGMAGNFFLDDGSVARLSARLGVGESGGLGASVTGRRGASVSAEVGQTWSGLAPLTTAHYGRVAASAWWTVETALRRRLLPPTLHLRVAGGIGTPDLPLPRAFGVDGRLAGVAPFGALRARTGRLTLAERFGLIAWEHDFRSVPFEALGWRGAAPRGVTLQVHGAHLWGRGMPLATRVESQIVHHEAGASLGLGYTVPVRLDVTYRFTDGPGVVVGIGLARLF